MRPRPRANEKEYKKFNEERFKRFSKCKENYQRYLATLRGGYTTECDYLPIKMDYEVSRHCNFKRRMCLFSEIGNNRLPNMTFEDYKSSIAGQIGLIEVKLQGLGEPLLNSDFFQMVEYSVNNHIWARTVTNASLFHLNDNYQRLIDSEIGENQISIDGATKETFEHIRRGSNFKQIITNRKMLNEYAESKGEAWRTSCWMLVQKDNFHEM